MSNAPHSVRQARSSPDTPAQPGTASSDEAGGEPATSSGLSFPFRTLPGFPRSDGGRACRAVRPNALKNGEATAMGVVCGADVVDDFAVEERLGAQSDSDDWCHFVEFC